MPSYELNGIKPVVEAGAYVHPEAVLIGDVIVREGCFVAPYAVMRGDFGRLILGKGSNLQENCCMHGFPDTDTIVEENGHIGHGAILHGCIIKKNAMVGMNSVVMDNAVVGENSIIGAHSLVKANDVIPANSLVVGSPAKVIRELSEEEIDWKSKGTGEYQMLSKHYANSLRQVEPETTEAKDRPRMTISSYTLKKK